MHLTRIRLGGVPPFTEPIDLKFDPQVNVFIGPNASGKSTLLQSIAERFLGTDETAKRVVLGEGVSLYEFPADEFDEYVQEKPEANVISASEDWFGTKCDYYRPEVPPTVVYIGAVRVGLPGIPNLDYLETYGETAAEALDGPFSGSRFRCACELLGKELTELGDKLRSDGDTAAYRKAVVLDYAIELSDACSKQICDEVVRDSKPHNYIPGRDIRDWLSHPRADLNRIIVLRLMGINTTDIRNYDGLPPEEQPSLSAYKEGEEPPIYLGHASSGTEGSILWIRWLALKLVQHYDFDRGSERDPENFRSFKDGWDKKPAILLIDEIENHLHPTWQRRVIPALLQHFPGLQIFATTHSPFVVAGLKAGQVHVLKRDDNGVVTASTNEQDVVGWTADEILRGMMGVDDPTDDATAQAAHELRKLRQEGPRASENEEEERQRQIQELRQLVNRDLLAGGPMAAQRELFEQNLAEILEEHRKKQGLSQD